MELNARTIRGRLNSNLQEDTDASLVAVHMFRAEASGLRSVLTCTSSGDANLHLIDGIQVHEDSFGTSWPICRMGNILCMKVDKSEKYAAFGGDGIDVSLWDIQTQNRIWEAKAPPRDSNGLMSRPFVTASTFLGDDHKKLVVGTGHHQVRLYDINARRRPMIAFDFLESPIKAVEADTDGNRVYIGTGNGALASFDMRSGKMLGSYKGRISGSIRCITVHPSLPVFAACGLDRFLRVFHKNSRELLTQIFLKQPLSVNVFDTHYPAKALTADDSAEVSSVEYSDNAFLYAENEMLDSVGSKKKKKKTKESKKMKSTQDELLEVDNNIYAVSEKACKKRKAQRLEGRESHLKAHKKKKRSESST
ncbi:hypothetical protein KP509_14G000500 [Ceratopteris richardii]|nr:hypothetical protein KP509_14G000500 [Ceratopteris richardii]KAH7414584.1 hypothetical protein KP509_14G000500 [Ceratopteris richardii]